MTYSFIKVTSLIALCHIVIHCTCLAIFFIPILATLPLFNVVNNVFDISTTRIGVFEFFTNSSPWTLCNIHCICHFLWTLDGLYFGINLHCGGVYDDPHLIHAAINCKVFSLIASIFGSPLFIIFLHQSVPKLTVSIILDYLSCSFVTPPVSNELRSRQKILGQVLSRLSDFKNQKKKVLKKRRAKKPVLNPFQPNFMQPNEVYFGRM